MKFKVDKQKFHKAITTVESIISSREIRSVISNVLIEVQNNTATLTATDLELGIKTSLEVETEQPGTITVPARKLSQSIREFRGSTISFESDEENRITIQDATGVSHARIMLMGTPSEEYPAIPSLPEDRYTSFPAAVSMDMIRKTGYAIAEEDARYVFNGLFLQNDGTKVSFVGTDGRRLAKIDRVFPETLAFQDGIIIPNKGVRELQKLLDSGETGMIAYDDRERRIHFRLGVVDLICKLIDGQYPDYRQVIPNTMSHKLKVNRLTLENSLRQVAVMAAEPSRQVRFTFAKGSITIAASTPDVGEAQDILSTEYDGEEITIAFNSNYLIDVIKVLNGEDIILGFSSSSAPAVILDPEDDDFVSVIMPMKV